MTPVPVKRACARSSCRTATCTCGCEGRGSREPSVRVESILVLHRCRHRYLACADSSNSPQCAAQCTLRRQFPYMPSHPLSRGGSVQDSFLTMQARFQSTGDPRAKSRHVYSRHVSPLPHFPSKSAFLSPPPYLVLYPIHLLSLHPAATHPAATRPAATRRPHASPLTEVAPVMRCSTFRSSCPA